MPDGSGRILSAARLRDPMIRAVVALGITEIISWGTTFYLLGSVGEQIARETGWGRTLAFAGMTVGLIAAGVASPTIGRLTDERGARIILTAGSLLAAAGLCAVALAPEPWTYLAGWVVLGLAMRMTLYDASFAAMVQVAPNRGRLAISYLTLFGGFASTVFWPIGYWLAAEYGWRVTLFVFAALHIAVCVPLNWWGLTPRDDDVRGAALPAPPAKHAVDDGPPLAGRERKIAFVLFTVMISANSFVFGAMSAHLISVLMAVGIAAAGAVLLASLKGVAQVAGRAWEVFLAPPMSAVTLGRIAVGLLPLAFLALVLGGASFQLALVFTLLFGVSNGLVTIVRGALPLALFGREGYGAMLGMLATPQLLTNAAAPLAYAAIVDAWGPSGGIAAVFAAAMLSFMCIEAMAWRARRRRA